MGLGGQGTLMRRAMDGTGLEQRCQQPTGASGLLYGPLEESVKRVRPIMVLLKWAQILQPLRCTRGHRQ